MPHAHLRSSLVALCALWTTVACTQPPAVAAPDTAPVVAQSVPPATVAEPTLDAPGVQAPPTPPAATATTAAIVPPVATVAPESAPATVLAPPVQDAVAPATFSAAHAMAHVEALAGPAIGSRPTGSRAEQAAVDYMVEQLRSWGYEPEVQAFPVRSYEDRGSQLVVLEGGQGTRALNPTTLQGSPAGQVEAPVVYAGLGRAEDFATVDARGKIALIQRGEIRFSQKVANAAAAGAVAAVVYNNEPGSLQGSLGGLAQIPAVSIPRDQGEALVREIEGSGAVRLRVEVDASFEEHTSYNVIATRPGTGGPDAGTVVVGGHADSVPAGPGANDNASGTAVVLELARVYATRDYPYTLKFIAFGAEEIGLVGSRYYVAQLSPEERRSIRAMINLDMVGVGDQWRIGGAEELVQAALGAAAEMDVRARKLTGPLSTASDHAPFAAADIPAVFIHRVNDPNYHTAQDRIEFVEPEALGEAGTIAQAVLDALAAEQR